MSSFIKHEPCPSCQSRDNLGVWDDGHKWCFGCGYYIPGYKGMSMEDLKKKLKQQEKGKEQNGSVYLPIDFDYGIPAEALNWLRKYGITDQEIAKYKLGWSDERNYLIFPVFDCFGNLLLWQGRYFGTNPDHPKYHTEGLVETVFHILNDSDDLLVNSKFICLVEDYVSAIKLARFYRVMPLFGSNLSLDRIRKLSDLVTSLVIWLDRDKLKEAVKARFKAKPFFNRVSVIVAKLDPKDYNDEELQRIVSRSQADDFGFSC